MKSEFVRVEGKGLCILISDLDLDRIPAFPNDLSLDQVKFSVFSDVMKIANEIRNGRKIAAIKEVRSQTGWGLKEAKEYVDEYYHNVDGFIRKHTFQEFLESGEMEI